MNGPVKSTTNGAEGGAAAPASRSRRTFVVLLICALFGSSLPACNTVRSWVNRPPKKEPAPLPPGSVILDPRNIETELRRPEFNPLERENLERLARLAQIFYEHLSHRRVNSIATFHDPALREFFQDEEAFADYYADLVHELSVAHFERNRPTSVSVKEVAVEPGAQRVRILVRFRGENNLPLRWWSTKYLRDDTWHYFDGRWWVVPGKV